MDKELIDRLAREAGLCVGDVTPSGMWNGGESYAVVARFAAGIAEECAKACEDVMAGPLGPHSDTFSAGGIACAAAIRAKFAP